MKNWRFLRDGIPQTEWEGHSLLNFAIGALCRLTAFLLILFLMFAGAKFAAMERMGAIGWSEFIRLYWTVLPFAAVPYLAFLVATEAWQRSKKAGKR